MEKMPHFLDICSSSLFFHPLPLSYWCLLRMTEFSPSLWLPTIPRWVLCVAHGKACHFVLPSAMDPPQCYGLSPGLWILQAAPSGCTPAISVPSDCTLSFLLVPHGVFILPKLPYLSPPSSFGNLTISLVPLLLCPLSPNFPCHVCVGDFGNEIQQP